MRFELVRSCGGGNCPAIYKTDRGTFLVQGRSTEVHDQMVVALGEAVVEIPADLLKGFGTEVV